MLVYLFRQRNADRALTTDVTGRNLPRRTPTHWMFVKALQIDKSQPLLGTVDFEEASRQLEQVGYYILKRTHGRD